MRRILSLFIALVLVLVLLPVATGTVAVASAAPAAPPSVNAASAIMIDARSGQVLYDLNSTDKVFPASTTKMMTAILAIESGKLDDTVKCGSEIKVSAGSSVMMNGTAKVPLVKDEEIKLNDLLYGMLLVSGNDAACATAVYLGGSIEDFATMMNNKARELGMNDTHFVNPHGVQNADHYSTAADMAKLARYCMQNETFRKVVSTTEYTVPATNKTKAARKLTTTNKLISKDPDDTKYNYAGAIGIKTGLTPTANGCLVAEAVKNDGEKDMQLIVCIYNDKNADGLNRWGIAKKLFDYGFNDFTSVDITAKLNQAKITPLDVNGVPVEATPVFATTGTQYYTGLKDKISQIDSATVTATPNWTKTEGFKKGDEIGTVEYKIGEDIVATAKLTATVDADKQVDSPTNEPSTSNLPASPNDPGFEDALKIKNTSIVAIVIVVVVLVAGIVMLIVMLARRRRKNAIYNRNARRRRGRNDYYNYRKRF